MTAHQISQNLNFMVSCQAASKAALVHNHLLICIIIVSDHVSVVHVAFC